MPSVTPPTTDLPADPSVGGLAPYDAVLLFSFGGPNGPDDVLPFLRNVTAGKNIPDERLAEVAEHYHHFGGRSPINEQNLALRAALQDELRRRGLDVPVVWGNRNWEPYTNDAIDELEAMGARNAVALVTSAYSSYSGCRQYREDLAVVLDRRGQLGPDGSTGVQFDKVRSYFNHPGFAQANVDALLDGYAALAQQGGDGAAARLVFVTHSIPDTMEAASHLLRDVLRAAPRPRARDRRRGLVPPGARRRVGPRVLLALGPAQPAVARAGRQRPPRGARAGRRP